MFLYLILFLQCWAWKAVLHLLSTLTTDLTCTTAHSTYFRSMPVTYLFIYLPIYFFKVFFHLEIFKSLLYVHWYFAGMYLCEGVRSPETKVTNSCEPLVSVWS